MTKKEQEINNIAVRLVNNASTVNIDDAINELRKRNFLVSKKEENLFRRCFEWHLEIQKEYEIYLEDYYLKN